MHNHQPSISVIVPIYNTEAFLRRCLDSLERQTFQDFEVLCINDCSTDKSTSIVSDFIQRDSRFIGANHEANRGAGAARNTGLAIARGAYIAFLDSDDTLECDALQKAFDHISKTQADICCFALSLDFPSKQLCTPFEHSLNLSLLPADLSEPFSCDLAKEAAFMFTNPSVCTKLFRHDFLQEINAQFAEHRVAEDLLFTYSAFIQTSSLAIVPEYLYNYNQEKSTSISKEPGNMTALLESMGLLKDKLEDLGLLTKYTPAFANLFLYHVGGTLTIMKDGESLQQAFSLLHDWRIWLNNQRISFLYSHYEDDYRSIIQGDPLEYATQLSRKRQSFIDDLSIHIRNQDARIGDLEKQYQDLLTRYDGIETSNSFKIGKIILWAPMRLKAILRNYTHHHE